jgi:hypothetical protein
MWLETLAADRPLAFLDHHFKQGNSLIGSNIEDIEELESDANGDDSQSSLAEFGATREGTIERLMDIYSEFLAIENETVEDVQEMKRKYAEIEQDELRRRLVAIANVHAAEKFDVDTPSGAYERMARALENDDEWQKVTETDWFGTAQQVAEDHDFFHWKLAFPEAFYDMDGSKKQADGFDAVMGNPPYVSNWELTERDEQLPEVLERFYPEATSGHWDLFVPFVYRGVELTEATGRQSFITPNALATEKYGVELREYLIKMCDIQQLVTFDELRVFDEVDRQYLIYIVSPSLKNNDCGIIRYSENSFEYEFTIDQDEFLTYSNNSFRIDLTTEDISIKEKVDDKSIDLGRLCFVNPGIVAHSASDSSLDFGKDDVIDEKSGEGKRKYISGGDIGRHEIQWDGKYIDYETYEEHFHRPKFPEMFESSKIMFGNISGAESAVRSCYDKEGYYSNHSIVHAVQWEPEIEKRSSSMNYDSIDNADQYDQRYVAGLANSKLATYYFANFLATGTLQGSYSRVSPENIRQLPVREMVFESPNRNNNFEVENLITNQNIDYESIINKLNSSRNVVLHDILAELTEYIIETNHKRNQLNLDLLDYMNQDPEDVSIVDLGVYTPPDDVGSTKLAATAEEYQNLRIGSICCERKSGHSIVIEATARYKPDDEDAYETDQWGYTETEPMPAMRLTDLTETEADLVEAFVPVAVEEAGGFAGFRETATKTNSLIDRLEAITLPDPDDVAEDLERYRDAVERAEELDEEIERTDDLIDEIVYDLYGLTDEEIEIVEEAVGDD